MSTKDDTGQWDGDSLNYTTYASDGTERVLRLERCAMQLAKYWVAADGVCYGITEATGQSCIAGVEDAVLLAGAKAVYVTWRPASQVPSTLKAWIAKWTKRTIAADRWDASLRVGQEVAK